MAAAGVGAGDGAVAAGMAEAVAAGPAVAAAVADVGCCAAKETRIHCQLK